MKDVRIPWVWHERRTFNLRNFNYFKNNKFDLRQATSFKQNPRNTYVFQCIHLRLSSKTNEIRTSFMNCIQLARKIMRCVTSSSAIASWTMRSTSFISLSICCFVSLRGLPVGFWSGGADNSREIELGLRRKRSPKAVGPMPSFACHMRASRFSSADMRGGCGGSFDGFGGMWPTPSACAGVWEDANVVKAAPTHEPVPLIHCTTFVKCNSHECILSDVRF